MRLRLVADALLLDAHHASAAPSVLAPLVAPDWKAVVDRLQAEITALRTQVLALQELVDGKDASSLTGVGADEKRGDEKDGVDECMIDQPVKHTGATSHVADQFSTADVEGNVDDKAEVEELQRKLVESITRAGDLQGVLDEPFQSERGRRTIEQIIEELQANCVELMVSLSKLGVSVGESSFPTLGAEER